MQTKSNLSAKNATSLRCRGNALKYTEQEESRQSIRTSFQKPIEAPALTLSLVPSRPAQTSPAPRMDHYPRSLLPQHSCFSRLGTSRSPTFPAQEPQHPSWFDRFVPDSSHPLHRQGSILICKIGPRCGFTRINVQTTASRCATGANSLSICA